ncbi:hypothetical protein [Nocardia wallacei]|uniref:hypothetical protein n=1 Tax=Nocardia wallacei TaxID=480035 RepID=UPI002457E48D|nr:hypothetical protein [Nocardia wallacei]
MLAGQHDEGTEAAATLGSENDILIEFATAGFNGILAQIATERVELITRSATVIVRRCPTPDCTMLFVKNQDSTGAAYSLTQTPLTRGISRGRAAARHNFASRSIENYFQ